jgi:hypothetical protein
MLLSDSEPPREPAADLLEAAVPVPDEGAGVCGCDADADDGAAFRFFVG